MYHNHLFLRNWLWLQEGELEAAKRSITQVRA